MRRPARTAALAALAALLARRLRRPRRRAESRRAHTDRRAHAGRGRQGARARGPTSTPQAIYERSSPGVVTVVSTGFSGLRRRRRLGLRDRRRRRGRRPTPTSSRRARAPRSSGRAGLRQLRGRQRGARRIVGFDPFSDVALLKHRPRRAAACARSSSAPTRGLRVGAPVAAIGSPFGEDRSLSTGIISALGALDRVADGLRDAGRDPDRHGDQPGQFRRAAARLARARDRDQLADPDAQRRQHGRRLRGPGRHCAALARAAARQRPRPLRLPRRRDRRRSSRSSPRASTWRRSRAPGSRRSHKGGPADNAGLHAGSGSTALPGAPLRKRRRRDRRRRRGADPRRGRAGRARRDAATRSAR